MAFYTQRAEQQGHRNELTKPVNLPEVNQRIVSPIGQLIDQAKSQIQHERNEDAAHYRPIKPKLDTGSASVSKKSRAITHNRDPVRDIFN